ncbi:MAG TPA: peptide deformylase [Planctomycetota bacterium]|nr:peptide deformylase [Planctomycetota bacterium]
MSEPQLMDIVLYPDPFLIKAARALTAEELREGKADGWNLAELVERMKATMYANEGVGLAAVQVRVGLRLFVADPSKDKTGFFAIFNPVLDNMTGSMLEEEGCLSIPGVRAKVKRAKSITVSGLDLSGKPVQIDATELLSRVCQHENDHLDGVLFISRIGMTAKFTARRRLEELEEDYKAEQGKKKSKRV